MRKRWPPIYDDFSVNVWAALSSVFVNLLGLICIAFGFINVLWWVGFPGLFAFVLLNGGIEEANSVWRISVGISSWVVINLLFYYFIARWVISAFRPVRGWWPERS